MVCSGEYLVKGGMGFVLESTWLKVAWGLFWRVPG